MPADAVKHRPQVFLGFIRFKGCVGGIISQNLNTKKKVGKSLKLLYLEFIIEDHRISSVAVECVDTRRNTKGEGNDLAIN